ncbi:Transcriptional regulator, Crp/Fnr family [hydrothermal vent metagenome]|uniref:Transcriptional regulator, Crp/Fnr family n=1 Tax=hydrothermal vent metagenome TaxID=652676 RepID=A0A3B0R9C6_9ZZZZ
MDKTKLWYISTNNIFSNLPKEDIEQMATMMTPRNIKKKGLVYSEGDVADQLYILKEGRIKISRLGADGKELTMDIIEPGDIFGELTLAGETQRETNAQALEDSFICTISRKNFEAFLGMRPDLSLTITKWIGLRLRKVESRLENLIFQDVHTRLYTLLETLAEKYGKDIPTGRKIAIKLSHQELANLIGATRETVTFELNKMKKRGIIKVEGREFILPSDGKAAR